MSTPSLCRRKLLLASLAGVILSLLVIAAGFQVADNRSPSGGWEGAGGSRKEQEAKKGEVRGRRE